MSSSSQGGKKLGFRSRLRKILPRTESTAIVPFTSKNPQESTSSSHNNAPSPSASIPPTTAPLPTPAPLPTQPTVDSMPAENPNLLPNEYATIGGLPTALPDPLTPGLQMGEKVHTAYRGLIAIVQALSDCSDIFLPLKTACNVILTIHKTIDRVSTNKDELEGLEVKLTAILSIVSKYKECDGIDVVRHRIESFCDAIKGQVDALEHLRNRPAGSRIAEGTEDADKISKAFRTMGVLCDVFQMDTQLNIEQAIVKHIKSGIIERLRHEGTSYKTRISSYGDVHGCLAGTRVQILADLEAWAVDSDACKVYWLVGMAGTGKSTICHTLCEILDNRSLLGASFFCSRASTKTNDARLIVPTIAHALASASPSVKSKVIEAIEKDETLPESTFSKLEVQFNKLIGDPLLACTGSDVKTCKVVVIDAVDECKNLDVASSLIKLILRAASQIPLKIFIASRDEPPIRAVFDSASSLRHRFILHEVEKDVVEGDIRKYVETSLSEINSPGRDDAQDMSKLIKQCGTLFIYAATAVRYITGARGFPNNRLAAFANRSATKKFQASLDDLYGQMLEQACADMEEDEISNMRNFASDIVFLQTPLPLQAIASLSETDIRADQLRQCLSPLHSVVHIPDYEGAAVALFHASFFDFITDPTRCTPERCKSFKALVSSEAHEQLALKCLVRMNRSLEYNDIDNTYGINKISQALEYSCLHWAVHLAGILPRRPSTQVLSALHHFLHTHLLHWKEYLSVLGKLLAGIISLQNANAFFSYFKVTDNQCHDLQLLVDAGQCLQKSYKTVQGTGECIGLRGFTDIYKANLNTLGSEQDQEVSLLVPVAVKVFWHFYSPQPYEEQRRISHGICVWEALSHPHIVPFLGFTNFGEQGLPALISPYYSHGNVMTYLKMKPNVNRFLIITQVASGLAYMHSQSIVHTNIKGNNILIDDNGVACISGFSLSCNLNKSNFNTETIVGTIRYLPIECFENAMVPVTMQRDVWSYAITVVEIMSGAQPFSQLLNDMAVIFFIVHGGHPQRKECMNLEPYVWKKLETCWDEDPTNRPTMAEMHQFLVSYHPSHLM